MDELSAAYAAVGRKQVELEASKAAYSKLLAVFAEVISGKCARSRVLVNLTDGTYSWANEGESPGMPATVNGLPVCVVGIQDEPPMKMLLTGKCECPDCKATLQVTARQDDAGFDAVLLEHKV